MNASNWIELAALLVTILGGGGIGVSKLTRVAVAIETFGKALETLTGAVGTANATVQDHATRLALAEARITQLETQHAAQQAAQLAAKP